MRLKTYLILLCTIVVPLSVILALIILKPDSQTSLASTAVPANEISATQISTHNTENDCWYSSGGSVYDLTALGSNSKSDILGLCGTISVTGEKSTMPSDRLSQHYIGILKP